MMKLKKPNMKAIQVDQGEVDLYIEHCSNVAMIISRVGHGSNLRERVSERVRLYTNLTGAEVE